MSASSFQLRGTERSELFSAVLCRQATQICCYDTNDDMAVTAVIHERNLERKSGASTMHQGFAHGGPLWTAFLTAQFSF